MKKISVLTLTVILTSGVLCAQDLPQKILFKRHKRTWQWDIGKTVFVAGNEVMAGTSFDIVGIIGKAGGKWAIGVDNVKDGTPFKSVPNSASVYRVQDYGMFNIRYEYLFRPDRLFYFSTSLKLGYGGMTREYINPAFGGVQTASSSETFGLLVPGVSVVCNILPGAGVGLNANYRFTKTYSAPPISTTGDTHYAFGVFLRLTINKNVTRPEKPKADSFNK